MKNIASSLPRPVSASLMLASGAAGLGYQLVWTQQCALWLGHESAALLAVTAAFLGGLGVGGLLLGARIEQSSRPVHWYAGLELLVALWSLVVLRSGEGFGEILQRAIGPQPPPLWHWLVAFGGTSLLLLPATVAMGATLPAMERLTRPPGVEQRSVASLYAFNTFGAVAGVLVVAFWLIPTRGLAESAATCAVLNVACAALALTSRWQVAVDGAPQPPRERRGALAAQARLSLTGLLGIGFEVLVIRVLSQVTECTVYTFALVLAVYLIGTGLGAAAYRKWLEGSPRNAVNDLLAIALASACVASTISVWFAAWLKASVADALGNSFAAAVAAEGVLAGVVLGAPTVLMGALFSGLCREAIARGVGVGRAFGVNLLAAASAPAIFGVALLPLMGPKLALLLGAVAYLAVVSQKSWSTRRLLACVPLAGAGVVASLTPPLRFVTIPEGGRLLSYEDGAMAAVSVTEDTLGVRRLHINNRQQEGSSHTRHVDVRQAWLPLLLHPRPRRALFLGVGTGVTAESASERADLQVDAVELLPEVVAASSYFRNGEGGDGLRKRPRLLVADARRYVRASGARYDVIVSDNFHPARSGSAALYTVEHFAAVQRRMAGDGIFCQWLPLHQLDLESLRSVVRSFLTVYPHGWALLASNSLETPVIGLIASARPRFELNELRARLAGAELPSSFPGAGLEDHLALLGSFFAGPGALTRFSANARLNTDDLPTVAYLAPSVTYAPESRPRDRLLALLGEVSLQPSELVSTASSPDEQRALADYWAARNRYLASGRDIRPSPRVEDMLAQVQEPLLEVLRLSPEFRPAYEPLLRMAGALARSNPARARQLLLELERIQPTRADARRLLATLREGVVEPAER